MKTSFLSAITLDNGLVIGVLGLITGMVPGILVFLSERQKLLEAKKLAESQRRSVERLEDLVTLLQNIIISIKDRNSTIEIPELESEDDGQDVDPVPPPTLQPNRPVAEEDRPRLPAEDSAKYVIWISPTDSTPPRYVLVNWEISGDGTRFRVRDYLGALMLYPKGTANPNDPNFRSIETTQTLEQIWGQAHCHIKARRELDHRVDDFAWWSDRLTQLTAGHESGHQLAPSLVGNEGTKGVLLMLSSSQKPPPRTEVKWHAANCSSGGTTYLATTRIQTGLVKDKSLIIFYGDVDMFNQVLGYGIFVNFIRTSTSEGQEILASNPHYNEYGTPDQVLGLIEMRGFKELPEGACLESFNARIASSGTANGLPLTLLNIPEGASRAQVYFQTFGQPVLA